MRLHSCDDLARMFTPGMPREDAGPGRMAEASPEVWVVDQYGQSIRQRIGIARLHQPCRLSMLQHLADLF